MSALFEELDYRKLAGSFCCFGFILEGPLWADD
jgi:hypothetical protein